MADTAPAMAYDPRSCCSSRTAPSPIMDICIRPTNPAAENRTAPGTFRTETYVPNMRGNSHCVVARPRWWPDDQSSRHPLLYRPAGTVYGVAEGTRERILAAVRDLLAAGGPGSVTLEAVADRAGVSKGGLLYHFPSKSALYLGLLEQVRDAVAAEMSARAAAGDAARAYLEYALPEDATEGGFFTS